MRVRLRWFRRICLRIAHWHGRALIWLAALLMLVGAGGAAWLQWWFFPHVDAYRPRVVAELSKRVGRPVEIGHVSGGWKIGRPFLVFDNLALKHTDGRPALTLRRVDATLDWWPLLLGDLRFDSVTAYSPDLELARDADGTLRLADIPLNSGKSDNSFGNWLLAQNELSIADGRLTWRDDMRQAPALVLEHVDFKLSDSLLSGHELNISAAPPVKLASDISVSANWRGDGIDNLDDWTGKVKASLAHVDLGAWRQWLPYPIEVNRGRGRLDLQLAFANQRVTQLSAKVDVQGANIRLTPELQALDLAAVSGDVNWTDKRGDKTLDLANLRLTADGGVLLSGAHATLQLNAKGGGTASVAGLTLSPLSNLPPALPLPTKLRKWLDGMRPAGQITQFDAKWSGDWQEPTSYGGKIAFEGLALGAPAPFPNVGELDGELEVTDHDGRLAVTSKKFRLADKDLFEQPLVFDQFKVAADWNRNQGTWTVNLKDFGASNADMEATANATWLWAGQGAGTLNLDANVARLAANKVADYLPTVIGPDTRKWLKMAMRQGEARNARFLLKGPLDKFPFADARDGSWSVVTQAQGVTLAYAPGWPALDNVNGEVRIIGDSLQVDAKAQSMNTQIERAHAVIEHLSSSPGIQIDGAVSGPTAQFFQFIAHSPLEKALGGIGSTSHATGDGKLSLKLDIPFANADDTHVEGVYRVAHNRLQVTDAMPEIYELAGDVKFNEHGVEAHGLKGIALGGPMTADLTTRQDGTVSIAASGRADAHAAVTRYGVPLADAVAGYSDYKVQVNVPHSGWQLAISAPMTEVRVDLPAPLGKRSGELRPLKLTLDAHAQDERWKVAVGDKLSADVIRVPESASWHIDRGEIRLGDGVANPTRAGLWLNIDQPEVNLDSWIDRLGGVSAASGGGHAAIGVSGIDLRARRLQVASRLLDDVTLHASALNEGGWTITAASQQISGKATWSPQGKGKLQARLDKLAFPLQAAERKPAAAAAATNNTTHLPSIDLVADDFRYRDHALGRLDIRAQQDHDTWQIDQLTVNNPDGKLSMQGTWMTIGQDEVTAVRVDIDSNNIGKLMDRFGYPEAMRRGSGSIHGDLTWRGTPMSPDYPTLGGKLKVRADNGQFAKIEPGVGRLLGVLSLQSLPRRLTLDFRDIFSEGFAFDRIEGDSKVVHGVMSTDNLSIVGPAAKVSFKGEADVAKETQKLRVRVVPTVGDSLAVGAGVALANPVVGVGAFLLQRVLKDPFGQLIAYEYDISGSWSDPQVVRIGQLSHVVPGVATPAVQK
ncbi:MAG: TIGR02099 family protein [Burkholderiales bacterium]|nr:TIGR02099 family protein [Burkholderiales bacterium]